MKRGYSSGNGKGKMELRGEFALNGEDLCDGYRFFVLFAGFQIQGIFFIGKLVVRRI